MPIRLDTRAPDFAKSFRAFLAVANSYVNS